MHVASGIKLQKSWWFYDGGASKLAIYARVSLHRDPIVMVRFMD